jgi:hypothetical protein
MDIMAHQRKMIARQEQLIRESPTTATEKAIVDLEMIICGIKPYSRWWRWGYIKSLRMAINALKETDRH